MMSSSPLHKLVNAHQEGVITKEVYLKVRTQLLDKLESQGDITLDDLENFLKLNQVEQQSYRIPYDLSDMIIIGLGIGASIALAFILYS